MVQKTVEPLVQKGKKTPFKSCNECNLDEISSEDCNEAVTVWMHVRKKDPSQNRTEALYAYSKLSRVQSRMLPQRQKNSFPSHNKALSEKRSKLLHKHLAIKRPTNQNDDGKTVTLSTKDYNNLKTRLTRA